jgi:uncharacterized protein YndB with AHSA1/START domain
MKKFLKYFLLTIVGIVVLFFLLGVVFPTQHYSISVTINKPVEKTFATFNDTTRMKEWMPGFQKIENISGNANEVGNKWRLYFNDHDRDIVMDETMTAFKQNELFTFNLSNEVINSDTEIRFKQIGNATEITNTCTYSGGNLFWKSMFVLVQNSVIEQQKKNFELLKMLVEK